jgi:hypothetical protein
MTRTPSYSTVLALSAIAQGATPAEAAKRYKVHPRTIRRAERAAGKPARAVGRPKPGPA